MSRRERPGDRRSDWSVHGEGLLVTSEPFVAVLPETIGFTFPFFDACSATTNQGCLLRDLSRAFRQTLKWA